LQVPSSAQINMKTKMVPRQPPPHLLAPQPARIALKKLFILLYF
jgi:hypothetical protein